MEQEYSEILILFVVLLPLKTSKDAFRFLAATLRMHITNQWFDNKVLVFPTEQFNTLFSNVAAKIHNYVLHNWAIKPPID